MNSDRNSDVDTPLFLVNGEVFPEGEQDENRLAAGAITDGDDISDVSNDSNIEQAAESSDERKPSKLTVQSARITVDDDAPLTALAVTPTTAADPFPLPTGPIDKSVKFQLIPISDTPGRHAVGEVVERRLGDGRMMQLGRQVVKDGQPVVKGNKKSTEVDVWFTSKVVSRLHAEMWVKNGTVHV